MSRVWRAALLLVLSLLVLVPAASAAPAFQWSTPRPQGEQLAAIAYGGGQFVAVGQGGAVLTSTDGATWKHRPFWVTGALHGVAYGAGRFVAVGAGGLMVTSVDGATWVRQNAGTRAHLYAVTYTGDRFVAVGSGGLLLLSADGLTWQEQRSETHFDLFAVAYGAGRYLAAGEMGTVITSADGMIWRRQPTGTANDLRGAAYGGGRFAVVGDKGAILTSTDGVEFKLEGARADDLKAVVRGADRFVAAGAQLSVSIIDAPWTVYRTLPVSATAQIHGLAYGGGRFVGIGQRGMIYRSTDGIDWTAVTPASAAEYGTLAFGGGQFVAGGQYGLIASPDGLSWTERLKADVSAVAAGDGVFLALGDKAYRSTDAVAWSEQPGPGFRPAAMVYGRQRFVAVGEKAAVSTDGLTWQTQAGPGEALRHAAAGPERFAAIGRSGAIFTSTDGLAWRMGFDSGLELAGLTFGNGRFLAASRSGSIYTSADGVTWSMRPRLQAQVSHIGFAAGHFLAMAPEGLFYASVDGDTWVRHAAGTVGGLRAAAGGQGRVVALGAGGAVLLHMGDFAPAPCGLRFPDMAGTYPACEAVERLAGRTVVTGYPDGTFKPEQTITRAEFAKLLVQTMGWQARPGAALPFSDAGGHWAANQGYLQAAFEMGVIAGFPDGTFRPDAPLSRAQAVKMAAAAAKLGQAAPAGYADVTAGAWYAGYVGGAQQRNLVGAGATTPLWDGPVFRESELAIRAEAAMLLDNLAR